MNAVGEGSPLIGLLSKAPGAIFRYAARIQAFLDAYYLCKLNLNIVETPKDFNGYFNTNVRVIDCPALQAAIVLRDRNIRSTAKVFPDVISFDTFDKCMLFCLFFIFALCFFLQTETKSTHHITTYKRLQKIQ